MTMHEMEVIKTLQRVCSVETALSQTVALETVRSRLHHHGFSALAESPGMPHLFRFVLEHGGQSTTNIMEPLFAYHEKFVNPKLRRLREHHFKDVCLVDNAWLRLILLQCAYAVERKQIRDTWIECFGPGAIAAIMKLKMKPIRDDAAIIVKTFHKDYAALAAYSHFPPGYMIKFLGRFGSKLGEALLAGGEAAQVVDGVRATTWRFEQELRKDMPNTQEMMLGQYLGKPSEVPEQKGASSTLAEQKSVSSTLISFDEDGNKRELALADPANEVMVIPWTCMEEHMDSQNEIVRARLFETLHVCSQAVSAVDSLGKVQLEGNPDKSDTCRVYCKEPALAGSLLFFPLIPHLQCIGTENVHPYRVQVGVNHQGKPLYLSPHVRLEGSTALAVPGWPYPGSKAWVVPFWTIRRSTDKKLCNCTLAEVDVGVIYTGGIGGEHLKVEDSRLVFGRELKLPVITNRHR